MRLLTKPGKPRLRNGGPAVFRVKPIRLWFGLSQDAFARALGVGRATVARWEAHNAGPNANTAEGRLLAAMIEARDLAIKSLGPSHARKWLHDPAPTFDGQQPIHVLVARGPIPIRDLLMESWEGIY